MELQGKVALVTGAGRRLGQAMARALADRGMTVAIHYHTSLFPNRSRTGWDNSTSWSTQPR
jgi:NAD(P)-dependent dehydrogenase (short-subunit alcohol dehydrogenase family)